MEWGGKERDTERDREAETKNGRDIASEEIGRMEGLKEREEAADRDREGTGTRTRRERRGSEER